MPNNRHLTLREVADRAGMSYYRVYRRALRGDLPIIEGSLETAGKYLIDEKDVTAWIEAGTPMTSANVYERYPRPDNTITVPEASATTGYTTEVIRQLCHDGTFEWTQPGGHKNRLYITRASFDEFMKRREDPKAAA